MARFPPRVGQLQRVSRSVGGSDKRWPQVHACSPALMLPRAMELRLTRRGRRARFGLAWTPTICRSRTARAKESKTGSPTCPRQELGLPVKDYSFPQRINFIRNTLRYKLPGEDYPCDIVMGVPAGYDQA